MAFERYSPTTSGRLAKPGIGLVRSGNHRHLRVGSDISIGKKVDLYYDVDTGRAAVVDTPDGRLTLLKRSTGAASYVNVTGFLRDMGLSASPVAFIPHERSTIDGCPAIVFDWPQEEANR